MRIFPLLLLLVVLAGCTFERRPDRASDADGDAPVAPVVGDEHRELQPADSVLLVARLYREALETGDISRALSFLHQGAALYSDAAAMLPSGSSAGEVLLQELRLRQEGLRLELLEAEATLVGEAALVVKRYRVTDAEGTVSVPEGSATALETIVLVRSATGWRIRHLHRSSAAGSD